MTRFALALALMCAAPLLGVTAPTPVAADEVSTVTTAQRGFVRPPAKEGYTYPDCYCTDSTGGRVEIGELSCLRIGRRDVLSRCEQADNLTIWRHQGEGCPGV
ncbi:MAG: hypothetical protein AAF675_09215 [Pseudomonadota bacterium]